MDDHREIQGLLPWYVTGTLEPDEQAGVEAHVAGCAACQAEVAFQRRLEAEVARLPIDVEEGWARMQRRVAADAAGPATKVARLAQARLAWAGWGLAATIALVAGAALGPPMLTASLSPGPKAAYHGLGAQPVAQPGNVVVIFRPDATEAEMRGVLKAAHARLVDGPTAADAWMLSVPAAERDAAVAALKTRREVVLAEPLDSGALSR